MRGGGRTGQLTRTIAALVLLLLCPGCSWAFVQAPTVAGPSTGTGHTAIECTERSAAPGADVVGATVGGLMVIGAAAWLIAVSAGARSTGSGSGPDQSALIMVPMGVLGLALGVPSALSASWGFGAVDRCARAFSDESNANAVFLALPIMAPAATLDAWLLARESATPP